MNVFELSEHRPGFVAEQIRANSEKNGNIPGREIARAAAHEIGEKAGKFLAQANAVVKRLVDRLTEEDREGVVRVWRESLNATRRYWDESAGGWVTEPDWKARQAAAGIIAAYDEGLPVARSESVVVTFKDNHERLIELARTPSGRREALRAGLISEEWLKVNGIEN